jgi:hypothetical protein
MSKFFYNFPVLTDVLDLLAKLWKVTISFIVSVCPSVHMEQIRSHWLNFHEIWYSSIFLKKSVEKMQV